MTAEFARHATKYFSEDISFETQFEVETIYGKFRLDFVTIDREGVVIGFECDGKEFHGPSRDEWRDAMILGTNKIAKIYRIRGCDINFRAEDIFYVLSVWGSWDFP